MDTEAALIYSIPLFMALCMGCIVFYVSKKYSHLIGINITIFLFVIVPVATFLQKAEGRGFLYIENLYLYSGIAISIMAFILSSILFAIRYFRLFAIRYFRQKGSRPEQQ